MFSITDQQVAEIGAIAAKRKGARVTDDYQWNGQSVLAIYANSPRDATWVLTRLAKQDPDLASTLAGVQQEDDSAGCYFYPGVQSAGKASSGTKTHAESRRSHPTSNPGLSSQDASSSDDIDSLLDAMFDEVPDEADL